MTLAWLGRYSGAEQGAVSGALQFTLPISVSAALLRDEPPRPAVGLPGVRAARRHPWSAAAARLKCETLTMSLPAKRCGRPPVLSCLEKKKRKQSLDRRRGKTRIYVGNHIDRWLTLKEKLDFRNDAEVAGFLLDLYDNCDPLSKASICSLPEDVRRITVKGERELPDDTSLIAADGTYDNDDQLSKESTCSGPEDVRIITVKEERDLPDDCSTETDDTTLNLCTPCSSSGTRSLAQRTFMFQKELFP
ncbi:uncharacterized protein LOC141998380 isoform X2 [Natator depressus]|uniref:uncharacterized protein LOC141998380 isoform X2 n=1 Tax=Natator depressus TaxID=27790 RepID=UPI003EC0A0D7